MQDKLNQAQKDEIAYDFEEWCEDETVDELTQAEKDEIIKDFKSWSGGFTPDMCDEEGGDDVTHKKYIEYSLDLKFAGREETVADFFRNYES